MQKTSFYTRRVRSCLIALLVIGWLLVGLKLPGRADEAKKVAVDASGNVVVTGYSWNGANEDYVTIKYSAAGAWNWGARYDGPD